MTPYRREKKARSRHAQFMRKCDRRLRGKHDRATFFALHGVWPDTPKGRRIAFVLAFDQGIKIVVRSFRRFGEACHRAALAMSRLHRETPHDPPLEPDDAIVAGVTTR